MGERHKTVAEGVMPEGFLRAAAGAGGAASGLTASGRRLGWGCIGSGLTEAVELDGQAGFAAGSIVLV